MQQLSQIFVDSWRIKREDGRERGREVCKKKRGVLV